MKNCRIIAITQPTIKSDGEEIKHYSYHDDLMTVEEFLAYVARVSNPSNQSNTLTANKLLKYLIKNKHFSPFEMVNIVQEINTTRDIARQILRHRSFSFQEFSQRYADINSLGVFHNKEARLQDTKNRQNSIETDDDSIQKEWNILQEHVIESAKDAYEWALNNGIAKEVARVVLPEGLTPSRLYMNGSLRSWIHYCQLRMANGTQKEHKLIATECWNNILKFFPSLKDILMIEDH